MAEGIGGGGVARSSRKHNEVRVIRGMRDGVNPNNKIYVYDGLYKIQDSWIEKAKGGGGGVFKYKLVRMAGQSSAFAVWKSIQKWKSGTPSRTFPMEMRVISHTLAARIEVVDRAKVSHLVREGDEYVFDTTRIYGQFKWNYEPRLLDEVDPNDSTNDYAMPYPLIIRAKNIGNVARFMNHSCSPNVFWQPVVYEENNQSYFHVAFFALRHIPPMTELTYDYGIAQSDHAEGSSSAETKGRKKCLCGSSRCCGSFG
ncbi:histone-lysine N-methyltransferase, H3 lysine-9 specific SUVH1 [Glycine max]|uniref:histone-lysine N-methyltransferase, H3 lysine-9 specific SUVH1 n=1 Tax=Glycine max TaxID=3847 RepID=UPI001B355195|nr:histone-lysine N-methyltransferase, H3 lysine-9 specific SUVH1 [Glycine max]